MAKFNTDAGTPKESTMIAPRTDAELIEFLQAQVAGLAADRQRLTEARDEMESARDRAEQERARLAHERNTLTAERDALRDFLEGRGYRRCDIPACNCNSWHGGRAEDRLREISESLSDAGVYGGTTIHGGVLDIIERAEKAEAQLAALTAERDQPRPESRCTFDDPRWRATMRDLLGTIKASDIALIEAAKRWKSRGDALQVQVDALTAEGVRLREQLEKAKNEKNVG